MTSASDALRAMFAHHTWATLGLLDALEALPARRLDDRIEGTYGSLLETMTHLVDADDRYLRRLTTSEQLPPYEDHRVQPVGELRARVHGQSARWTAMLDRLHAGELEATIPTREDRPETPHAEGLLLLQAIHHGNDHRTQVCSTLGALGLDVPDLDGWSYWEAERRS